MADVKMADAEDSQFSPLHRKGQGLDNFHEFWEVYNDKISSSDREMLAAWNESLGILLVFAGLSSAILSAFLVLVIVDLRPDDAATTNVLLQELLRSSNPSSLHAISPLPETGFSNARRVSLIWLISLSFSLLASFGAIVAKQWLAEFERGIAFAGPLHLQGRLRQKRFSASKRWNFRAIIESLPTLLQISLALFGVGLVDLIWPLDSGLSLAVMVVFALGATFHFATLFVGLVDEDSPFRTPFAVKINPWLRYVGVKIQYQLLEPLQSTFAAFSQKVAAALRKLLSALTSTCYQGWEAWMHMWGWVGGRQAKKSSSDVESGVASGTDDAVREKGIFGLGEGEELDPRWLIQSRSDALQFSYRTGAEAVARIFQYFPQDRKAISVACDAIIATEMGTPSRCLLDIGVLQLLLSSLDEFTAAISVNDHQAIPANHITSLNYYLYAICHILWSSEERHKDHVTRLLRIMGPTLAVVEASKPKPAFVVVIYCLQSLHCDIENDEMLEQRFHQEILDCSHSENLALRSLTMESLMRVEPRTLQKLVGLAWPTPEHLKLMSDREVSTFACAITVASYGPIELETRVAINCRKLDKSEDLPFNIIRAIIAYAQSQVDSVENTEIAIFLMAAVDHCQLFSPDRGLDDATSSLFEPFVDAITHIVSRSASQIYEWPEATLVLEVMKLIRASRPLSDRVSDVLRHQSTSYERIVDNVRTCFSVLPLLCSPNDIEALKDVFFFLRLVFNNRSDDFTTTDPSAQALLRNAHDLKGVASVIMKSMSSDDFSLHEDLIHILFPPGCATQPLDKFNAFSLFFATPSSYAVNTFQEVAFAHRMCELIGRFDYPSQCARALNQGILGSMRIENMRHRYIAAGALSMFCMVVVTVHPHELYQNVEEDRRNQAVATLQQIINILADGATPSSDQYYLHIAGGALERWVTSKARSMGSLEEMMYQVNDEKVKAIAKFLLGKESI